MRGDIKRTCGWCKITFTYQRHYQWMTHESGCEARVRAERERQAEVDAVFGERVSGLR